MVEFGKNLKNITVTPAPERKKKPKPEPSGFGGEPAVAPIEPQTPAGVLTGKDPEPEPLELPDAASGGTVETQFARPGPEPDSVDKPAETAPKVTAPEKIILPDNPPLSKCRAKPLNKKKHKHNKKKRRHGR